MQLLGSGAPSSLGHPPIRELLRRHGGTPASPFEVKPPAESHGPWGYDKPLAAVPADQAWHTLEEGGCRLRE